MQKYSFALIALMVSSSAFAQTDRCADVLSQGVFATTMYQSNTTYRRMLDSYLSTLTYDQAKTDRTLTGNIPIGEVILGVGFSENRLATHKATTNFSSTERVDYANATTVAIQAGDPNILNAWTSCMRGRGGFAARFEAVNSTTATLVLEWFTFGGISRVTVNPKFTLPPGVQLTSGKEYLTKREPIIGNSPARIQLKLDAATTPVALTLNLEEGRGSDAVYLPPRLRPKIEKRAFSFASSSCNTNPTITHDTLAHTGTTSALFTYCSDVKEGWIFSQSPEDWSVRTSVSAGGPLNFAIFHTATFISQDRFLAQLGCSSSSNTDIRCQGFIALTEARQKWVPIVD